MATRTLVERQFARWNQALGSARGLLLLRNPDLSNAVDLARRWGDELDASTRDFIRRSFRRARLAQGTIYGSFVAVILGLLGWINQSYIAEQWRWVTVTLPYAAAQVWPHVLTAAQEQALKPGESFKECAKDCPEMLVIPAGTFPMGSPQAYESANKTEFPQHIVAIAKPFAVSKYEVTFTDWDACVAGGGCNGYKPPDQSWGQGRQPVINVDWNDAQAYVSWLSQVTGKSYRLLSEAEYEYAARAGTETIFPWGDAVSPSGQAMANCNGCGSQWDNRRTAPVGSFTPNEFGLYDMVGNVLEWVEDCYRAGYVGAPADGSARTSDMCHARVVRSGSWRQDATSVRSAKRDGRSIEARGGEIGFRVARTLLRP